MAPTASQKPAFFSRLKSILSGGNTPLTPTPEPPKPTLPIATRPPKIGLALGCGGAKSLAHIGVLKVLEENDIPIHAVSGCSMGALIGSLWATGHSIEKMLELAGALQNREKMNEFADPVIPPIKGLFHGLKVKEYLRQYIGDAKIEELDRRFLAVAANIETYETVVFRDGLLIDAVHASSAIPGVAVPFEHRGMRLVDGGVVDPVPVGVLKKFTDCDYVIAVSTTIRLIDLDDHSNAVEITREDEPQSDDPWWKNPLNTIGKRLNPASPGNMLDTVRRSLKASQIRIAHESCRRADIAIHPVVANARWHEFEHHNTFIELGEERTRAVLECIKALTEPIPIETAPEDPEQEAIA